MQKQLGIHPMREELDGASSRAQVWELSDSAPQDKIVVCSRLMTHACFLSTTYKLVSDLT